MFEPRQTYTCEEIAAQLSCDPRTVKRWAIDGDGHSGIRLAYLNFSKPTSRQHRIRIVGADINRFMDKMRKANSAKPVPAASRKRRTKKKTRSFIQFVSVK